MVTCTFGQNAHTTRGFSWVSMGYYDEYIWFENDDGEFIEGENIFESFKKENNKDSGVIAEHRPDHKNWRDPIYDRLRLIATDGTAFTVHKFFKDWEEVEDTKEIRYKVGREGN